MMLVYFRRCLAGRRECQHRDIRAGAPTMSRDRAPKSCQALLPAARAIFVLDGRVWDHQVQDIALETILSETRRNREWFSARWRWLLQFLKQTSGPRWTE